MASVRQRTPRQRLRELLPEHIRVKTRLIRGQIFEVNRFVATLAAVVITSLVPSHFDQSITEAILRFYCRVKHKRINRSMEKKIALLSTPDHQITSDEARKIAVDFHRMRVEIRWSQARAIGLQPSVPDTQIEGLEHMKQALTKGTGVILWRMSFTGATPLNAALFQHGYHIVHLSSSIHLATTYSWFSINVVGPLLSYDEARFLARRVISQKGRATGYLDQLKEALCENGIVSMVGDVGIGRVKSKVKSGNSSINVPSGAPSLARATGAALLPCVAVRIAPFSYKIIILPNAAPDTNVEKLLFRDIAIDRYAAARSAVLKMYPASDANY